MHVLATVAQEYGIGDRVYARPYAAVFYEYLAIRERESIAAINEAQDRLTLANMIGQAVWAPEQLQAVVADLNDRAGTTPTPEEREAEKVAAQAEADAILAGFAAAQQKALTAGRA
jgi:hypothetical protein